MEILQHIGTVLKRPGLLRYHRPIFLLSHMRANTSLLGHIFGSHPEISGYYEMHNGYFSKKSLLRQKLLFYRDHPYKMEARYMFDKVLHDFHYVDLDLLNESQAKILFSLREPEQTIKSIVSLFRNKQGSHEFANVEAAGDYYCQRVQSLAKMAPRVNDFYYFNADELRSNTAALLSDLSDWLELGEPLSEEFGSFRFSSTPGAGDTSGRLTSGRVEAGKTGYDDIRLSSELMGRAEAVYRESERTLRQHSVNC